MNFFSFVTLSILISSFFFLGAEAKAAENKTRRIKGTTSAIYYEVVGVGRFVFPNFKVYESWYFPSHFINPEDPIHVLSDEELSKIPLKGNVTYNQNYHFARMVKIQTSPKVYVVEKGGKLRWVKTEQVAKDIFGERWFEKIHDIPEVFFSDYVIGEPIEKIQDYKTPENISLFNDLNLRFNFVQTRDE